MNLLNIHKHTQILKKPSWHPPGWLFGPAWAYLFTSMGYASFLIYRDGVGVDRDVALGLYASSIFFNQLGNPIFGGFISRGWVFYIYPK
jgi:tryptophan-rich sensory protein